MNTYAMPLPLLALTHAVPDVLAVPAVIGCALLTLRLRRTGAAHARQNAFLTAVLRCLGDRVVVADAQGRVIAGDGDLALYELDGETPLDPAGSPLPRALAGEAIDGLELVARPRAADGGDPRRLLVHAAPVVGPDGRRLGAVATGADITRAREAELRLAEANLVLRAVRDVARSLHDDDDVPRAICQAARFAAGARFTVLYEPEDDGRLVATGAAGDAQDAAEVVARAFASGVRVTDEAAFTMAQPVVRDDRTLAVLAAGWREPPATLSEPAMMSLELFAEEAATALERAALIARLRETSRRDPLTGLPNRRAWDEELDRELSRARRDGHPVCVALLDLDHFKAYNDEHGHQAGDWLLETVATAWADVLRDSDTVARWGGEEFAVCLPNCSPVEAEMVLGRLRTRIPDRQTCSVGLAQWDGRETSADLLRRADGALYDAKDAGRDRLVAA